MTGDGRAADMVQERAPVAHRDAWTLACIVGAYLCLGAAFALGTPPWQAPDEPAHYNYIADIVEQGALPVLSQGDYPAQYLETIKSQRFAPSLSIAPLRYESHQPPLYYLWSSLVYRLAKPLGPIGSLRALRLWAVVLGALGLIVCYGVVRAFAPDDWVLAAGATAFAATLPMHVAMTASVNSDVLVELLVALVAWQLLATGDGRWDRRRSLSIGVILGLAILTKMQTYPALAMAGMALTWDCLIQGHRRDWRALARNGASMYGVALAMAAPWVWRNIRLYGAADPLGLVRHDQVVLGQLTSAEFLAGVGWPSFLRRFVVTTFHSVWGQFGWMAAPLDNRVYALLAIVTALVCIGATSIAWRVLGRWSRTPLREKRGILLLATWLCVTTAGYLWYNTKYVQFQGRYLFPAIVPLGVLFTAGLRRALEMPLRFSLGPVAAGLGVVTAGGLVARDMPTFGIAALVAAGIAVCLGHWMQHRRGAAAILAFYGVMALLSVYSLAWVVVPSLTP